MGVVLTVVVLNQLQMPEYNPERTYLDMEEAILEAFILAKDSATIQLPEGHYLFSQELSISGKKHLTIKGMGMDKTVLSFKGQTKGAQGIIISNSQNITLADMTIEDAAGEMAMLKELYDRLKDAPWEEYPEEETQEQY